MANNFTCGQIPLISNEQLLEEYTDNCRHAGDDFCITPYTDKDSAYGDKLYEELLSRMGDVK